MYTFEFSSESNYGRRGRGQTGQVCHTFPQIAMIVAKRHGESISPADVERICHTAEAKFVSALLADLAGYSRPSFDQPADHSLQLRGSRDHYANYVRRN